jgi:hypothetical protein
MDLFVDYPDFIIRNAIIMTGRDVREAGDK